MEEIEVKFLEVNVEDLENKLIKFGAEKIGETLSRINTFDYPDFRLHQEHSYVRLRTEFDSTTLTFKQRLGVTENNDIGMKEIEVTVSDFDSTKKILYSIGMIDKFYQERKRVRFIKDDIVFDIDTWPLVPTYVEIEGPSLHKLKIVSEELGFDWGKHLVGSFAQVCKIYGLNDHDYTVFTFEQQIKK